MTGDADWDPLAGLRDPATRRRVALEVDAQGDAEDLLAALGLLFSRYSGSATLALGVPCGVVILSVDEDQPVAVYRKHVATACEQVEATDRVPAVGLVVDDIVPFPLTVHLAEDRATCRLDDNAFAGQLVRQLARLVTELHGDQNRPLSDLTLDDETEQRRLAEVGVTPGVLHPVTIHDAFAEQARRTPDAIALTWQDTQVDYTALADRADRIAAGLHARGVRPGDRVGLVHERDAELVALLLGVLKAGAVYVPLDPAYPDQRLAFIAADAELALVITDDAGASRVPGHVTVRAAELDGEPGPAVDVDPSAPAYVIYTSGSTGRPKGVVVPHRNVVALIRGTAEDFGLGADVWTWFHSVAFDFSVWEIWGCLLTGGRLVVVPEWTRRSPDEFAALLRDERVTVLNQTPSSFAQVIETQLRRFDDLALRLVIFGGEPLDAFALLPWFDRYPETRCRLVNMFGITETTVHVTAQTLTRADALAGSRSVGRAIPGWEVRVVDARRRPVAPGVPGEIAVGGAGLARGYLGRPGLTAERFVHDPRTGRRLYLSGDLGRLLPDGRLEHLGRLDGQVKLRGYRIEPDEIRKVLLADPAVLAAAVVVAEAGTPNARLDAYVVLNDGSGTSGLRSRAAALLPDYMVPSTITPIDALPLTVNRKLDQTKLPKPTLGSAPAARAEGDADVVLTAWRQVLGPAIGPDDHFFDVGGNSLLAAKILAALRAQGLTVGIRDLYGQPTPSRLAAQLAEQKEAQP